MTDIANAEGEKLSELSIDLDGYRDGVMQYQVESTGEKETEFELPRYDIFLGWIEIFGIPPFNEWVLLDEFDSLQKEFSGEINGKNYTEELSISDLGPAGTSIELARSLGNESERYRIREAEYTPGSTSGGIALFDVEHSEGTYSARIIRTIAQEDQEMEELRELLEEEEKDYLDRITREEGSPSIVVLKEARVDGTTPPVYRKMFPFWKTEEFTDAGVRSLEIGYMDRGDTEAEVDKLHGDWYKLFSFEEFDHDWLEIREGNWRSTDIDIDGEKKATKEHYEKHLYRYQP